MAMPRKNTSMDVISAILADAETVFSKSGTFNPPEGDTVIRILPGTKGPIFYARGVYHSINSDKLEILTHKKRAEGGRYRLLCSRMFSEPCCIEQYMDRLNELGGPTERRVAEALQTDVRVFTNVGLPNRPNEAPQILPFSKGTFFKLIEFMKGKPLASIPGVDFTDPHTGRNLVLTRTGKGLKTRWDITMKPVPEPLAKHEWLEQRHDLEAYVRKGLLPYEEALNQLTMSQAMIVGLSPNFIDEGSITDTEEQEEHEEVAPAAVSSKKFRRKN